MEWIGNIKAVIDCNGEVFEIDVNDARIKITQPRNIRFHNLVFGCLGFTLNNMTKKNNVDSTARLLMAYKEYRGMYDLVGKDMKEYHSINFLSMDQVEFEPIGNDILDFCCLVLNDKPREITDKLMEIMFPNEG